MIIEKALDDIDLEDLEQLVVGEVPEGKEIEYKEYLNLADTKHKETLLGEITSFANARGGDLIVGIPEDDGTPEKVAGFPVDKVDKTVDRWANTIRRGADPKLPPSLFDINSLHVKDDRHVLIVRVKKSWNPPHRVRRNNRFYGRGPNGKFDLETAEIRRRILETERLTEELQDFRSDSISEYVSGDTPLPVYPGPKVLFHLIPVSAFSTGNNIDRKTAGAGSRIRPRFLAPESTTGGLSDNYTVDSVIVHQGVPEDGLRDYVRTFSSGIIEMFSAWPFEPMSGDKNTINVEWLKKAFEFALPRQLQYLESQDVDPPIYACLSLLDAEGYAVSTRALLRRQQITFDPVVHLPEVMIESFDTDVDDIREQLVEYLYNAGGLSGPKSRM